MNPVIGLPRGFFWHRYGELWRVFFSSLGCDVVTSAPTTAATLESGTRDAMSESCLPAKVFAGHVRSLSGRCDLILVPHACSRYGGNNYCARFWGLADTVRSSCPNARILAAAICEDARSCRREFARIGKNLGFPPRDVREACEAALAAQAAHDARQTAVQEESLKTHEGRAVLICGRPYITRDAFLSGAVTDAVKHSGGTPLLADRFARAVTVPRSGEISPRLYWTENRESVGAIAAFRDRVDGAILLSAYPCASDALSGEIAVRSANGLPVMRLTLDGLAGHAGIETRVESFMDILAFRADMRGAS